MKRLITKDQEEKKKKRNQWILSVFLVFIMFFSVIGYSFVGKSDGGGTSTKVEYNGFEFIKQDSVWRLDNRGFKFFFKYNPNEVEKISSKVSNLETYYGKPLYMYSKNNEVTSEIYTNLNQIVQRIQFACLDEKECEENWPVKTCKDNFIIIKENNDSKIIQEDNCVFIMGPYENLTMISDAFLFKTLGVEQ